MVISPLKLQSILTDLNKSVFKYPVTNNYLVSQAKSLEAKGKIYYNATHAKWYKRNEQAN